MSADGKTPVPGRASPSVRRRRDALALALLIAAFSIPACAAAAGELASPNVTAARVPWAPSDLGVDLTFPPMLRYAPPSSVIERIPSSDPDAIRKARLPSIGRVARLDGATRLVELDHFGRRLESELGAALSPVDELILDLRHNHGGSLRIMLRAAAHFTGPVQRALMLVADDGVTVLAIPEPPGPVWHGRLTVLVGDDTISSGEVLAALLRRYAGAALLGERTWGKDYAQRVVALDPEWQTLVPAGRIEIPGETVHGGLLPDGPIPPAMQARIADHRIAAGAEKTN